MDWEHRKALTDHLRPQVGTVLVKNMQGREKQLAQLVGERAKLDPAYLLAIT